MFHNFDKFWFFDFIKCIFSSFKICGVTLIYKVFINFESDYLRNEYHNLTTYNVHSSVQLKLFVQSDLGFILCFVITITGNL